MRCLTRRVMRWVRGVEGCGGVPRGRAERCSPLVRHPGRAVTSGVRYFCTVDKKNALRAGALAAGTTLMMLLMSSPALALARDDGDDPGPGLSVIETLGLYVLAPLVVFGVITGLVMALDRSTDRRPKPGTKAKVAAKA